MTRIHSLHGVAALALIVPGCFAEDCIFDSKATYHWPSDTGDSAADPDSGETGPPEDTGPPVDTQPPEDTQPPVETGDTGCVPTGDEQPYNGLDDDCDPGTPDDDLDGDGHGIDSDCDDDDAAVGPDAAEACFQRARADAAVIGEAEQGLGSGLLGLDDLDGDGVAELAVGAEEADGWRGAVLLLSGAALAGGATLQADEALVRIVGDAEYDSLGGAGELLALPDISGDGAAELLLACPGADPGGFTNIGEVYLLSSATIPVDGSTVSADDAATVAFQGRNSSDRFGVAMGAGDLDGDGLTDLVVGSPGDDMARDEAGLVAVFLGVGLEAAAVSAADADAWLFGAYQEGLGEGAITVVDDLDGDGRRDLLVGSVGGDDADGSETGVVYLLAADGLGSADITDQAFAVVAGGAYDDQLGVAAGSPGDLDGDGAAELAVGALKGDAGVTNGGGLYLLSGGDGLAGWLDVSAAARSWGSQTSLARAGSVLEAADLDGDGLGDLLASAPWEAGGGTAAVLSGAGFEAWQGGTLADDARVLIDSHEQDGLGSALLALDLDGAGLPDLIIGAPEAEGSAGGAYIFTR